MVVLQRDRELGKVISNCAHGVIYAVVGKDGVMEWKSQAGLLYADNVCLMASNEEDMNVIIEKVNECIVEYDFKVNEKKSTVVCINSEVGRRRWMMGDCCIGKQVSDKFTISNALNTYFVEIGPQLERSINTTVNPLTYVKSSSNSMLMPYVEEHEIIGIVYQLKESSPGWDSIPASVAKATIQSYIKPLTSLINSSFENGLFPDELKLTTVIPIFKNGDKTDVTNYRPISVLSFFSRIFEKTINNCLIKFIDKHGIIHKYQFGFRKSHSTSHAIISIVEKINNALDFFLIGRILLHKNS